MVYPSTTTYLTRKLNWMARKLRFMNDASAIKEWTQAMDCIFNSLENYSKNKDLSTPMQMGLKKMEIQRGKNINVLSWHDGMKATVLTEDLKKTGSQRRDGKPAYRKGMETEKIEKRNNPIPYGDCPPKVQVEWEDEDMCDPKSAVMEMLNKTEVETQSESLFLDGDEIIRGGVVTTKWDGDADFVDKVVVGTTGEDRPRGKSADREKIKLWWKEALLRKLKREDKEKEHWAGNEGFTSLLISCGKDWELTQHLTQMFPKNTGEAFLIVPKDDLRIFLNKEMNNFYRLKT